MGLFDGFSDPSGNTEKAYKSSKKGYRRTMRKTNPFYRQVMRDGQAANNRLADFLQLNGPEATQAAYDSYMTGPGFDFQMQNGINAIDASANARGGLYSGKTLMGQQQFGQGLYSQELNNYLNRLSGQTQTGFQGAQGLMNNKMGLNNLKIGYGQAQDAGNQAALGNALGLAGTIGSFAMGMPSFGGTTQAAAPQMPTYTNGRVNPYGVY